MIKCLFVCLFVFFFEVTCFADKKLVADGKETTFTLQKKYGFYESLYKPKVSFLNVEEKYKRKTFINPAPEYISFYTIKAMKESNYDNWLEFWDKKSRLTISKKDSDPKNKIKRKNDWEDILGRGKSISLFSQIQVGKAQYTYSMIIYEIVYDNRPDVAAKYVYFGFVLDKNGIWKLSKGVEEHPVFKYYISKRIGQYG